MEHPTPRYASFWIGILEAGPLVEGLHIHKKNLKIKDLPVSVVWDAVIYKAERDLLKRAGDLENDPRTAESVKILQRAMVDHLSDACIAPGPRE